MGKKFNFFKEAVKNYKTSGTIVPSSRYLADRMLKKVDFNKAKVIVELGPGNGAITNHILKNINSNTILICFEINNIFYNELLAIEHKQLIVLNVSAENLIQEVRKLGFSEVDYIVSSLPFTIIPNDVSNNILKKSYDVLSSNGLFIQYQYSLSYYKKLKKVFGDNISLDFEPLNFPPAFVYKCAKN